jgi:hypothetical protein
MITLTWKTGLFAKRESHTCKKNNNNNNKQINANNSDIVIFVFGWHVGYSHLVKCICSRDIYIMNSEMM